MRTIDDCTYQEYKDGVFGAFLLWKDDPEKWTPENCTNRLLDDEFEYSDNEPLVGTSEFLFFYRLANMK